MPRSLVTLDLGNSRAKLRRWRVAAGERPIATLACEHDVDASIADDGARGRALAARVLEDLARAGDERVAFCSVASDATERALAAELERSLGGAFVARPEPGVDVDVVEPARVGRDRLFAARGAFELLGTGALVVDAGTCVTVDAVRAPRATSERARFLGGAIAPGPRLLADALARGGARLARIEPTPGAAALGRDTSSALASGVVVGLRGAVRELVVEIGRATWLDRAPIAWTGGAARFLLEPPIFPEREGVVEPDLVHLGLLAALGVPVAGPR